MKRTPQRWAVGMCTVVVAAACIAHAGAQSARAPLSKAQWTEDVRYFARELPKRHKNAYHSTPKAELDRVIAALEADIPTLQEHQIIVRLRQIAAMVGDGHTAVRQAPTTRYPINLYWFGRELRVIAAGKDYPRALGARVVKIGGMDIDDVERRVATCVPSAANENEWFVTNATPGLMVRPEILHALGVVAELSRATFTFLDDQGAEFSMELPSVPVPPPANGVVMLGLQPVSQPELLYRQRPGEPFWFTYLEDSKTMFVAWRRYQSLGTHSRALFAAIDRQKPARVVIDLRLNGGGDFFEGRDHLIEPIRKRPEINRKGRLFVIVGRTTFSAAMVNAIDFRKQTNAILVGEPIGERPNSYSENDEMTLPNSRLVVSYSTRYYKFLDEDVSAVLPDHHVDAAWNDFAAGRDSVMEWILRQP